MEISIIGTGKVGGVLGKRWSKTGHRIIYGSRDPQSKRVQNLVEETGGSAQAAAPNEAMRIAHVIVLAVPWKSVRYLLSDAGDLAGKIIIDATNAAPLPEGGSLAEQVAGWAPGAQVVKAFNTTGSDNMANPIYEGQNLTMFICGDAEDAKGTVAALAEKLGFEVVDAGGLDSAIHLESLARLWIHLAYDCGMGKQIGFKLFRR